MRSEAGADASTEDTFTSVVGDAGVVSSAGEDVGGVVVDSFDGDGDAVDSAVIV